MKKKIGVLIVNLGTPDSAATSDVRKYLIEFLTDERVIDKPWLQRQLLVRGIIAPFRAPESAKTYKEIWDSKTGSPLLHYSLGLAKNLQNVFDKADDDAEYIVELAMRYQTPNIPDALKRLQEKEVDKIIVFPLFPQYASATTGSVHQYVMEIVGKWWEIPDISFINSYYDNDEMNEIFANNGKAYGIENYDHVLFSFHGLPEGQLIKGNRHNHCTKVENCCSEIGEYNRYCYSAQCHATAKLIAQKCNLKEEDYTICYQSRLGKEEWVKPYTTNVIAQLAEQGKKKMLVFCPAFVADCLETVFEVSVEYQEEFEEKGGEHLQLVESLNDSYQWAEAIRNIVISH